MARTEEGLMMMSDPPRGGAWSLAPVEPQLFAKRIQTVIDPPNGADVVFTGFDHDGGVFICKDDRSGRSVRATELIFTRLAERLGLRVAECALIEHDGETFFGSRQEVSTLGPFEAKEFLTTPRKNELGQPAEFPGAYLAQMLVYDMFIGNWDRSLQNFLVVLEAGMRRLCAIDFAAGNLGSLTTDRFPVASDQTVIVGRRLRRIHGTFERAALNMIELIASLPKAAFDHIVRDVPEDWLTHDERGGLLEVWGSPGFFDRLAALRAGIVNGTLV